MKYSIVFLATALALADPAYGFNNALFHEAATLQRTAPSKTEGVEIELPDFEEMFSRVQTVSPLARVAMNNGNRGATKGFAAVDDSFPQDLQWKTIESNKRKTVFQVDKIDNFQNLGSPILRFRSSMQGPCIGECFARFIMDLEERQKWDAQIAQVYERYPIYDLDAVNIAMGFGKYGECSRLGVGYCQTKPNFAVPSREQLTLCGIQEFPDGACVIWGTEMEEWHNHLLPPGERFTRARTHIFSTTLVPTSEDSFDVEYVLQLDIGGKIPTWLTEPIVRETVKSLFKTASEYFSQAGKGGELDEYLKKKRNNNDLDGLAGRNMLLMTP